jgi:DNA-binding phage protein
VSTRGAEWKETVEARMRRDRAFRDALLCEGVNALLAGDVAAGKSVLRDFINATIGFEALASATGIAAKSLMRMFGPDGNPQAQNLFAVLGHLQKHARVRVEVRTVRMRSTSGTPTRAVVREAIRKVVVRPQSAGPVAIWDGEPRRTAVDHDSVHDEP